MYFLVWFVVNKINKILCGCGVGFFEFSVGWKI